MTFVDEKTAYEDLANAIVLQAVKDYKRAMIHLKRNPDSKGAVQNVKRLESFFHGDWYMMLTDLDPSYLIWKMKEMVDERFPSCRYGMISEEDDNAHRMEFFG